MFISTTRHYELVRSFDKYKADRALRDSGKEVEYEKLATKYAELQVKLNEEFELKEKKVVAAFEDKLSKSISDLEDNHRKEITALKEKHLEDKARFMEEGLTKNYDKLSNSLTKLHEEGNVQTKFVQELALKMSDSFTPASYTKIAITE